MCGESRTHGSEGGGAGNSSRLPGGVGINANPEKQKKLWRKNSSGFLIPDGSVSNLSQTSKNNYLSIKEKSVKLESIFDEASIAIPATCDLAKLVLSAKELSDSWLTKLAEDIPFTILFQAAHFERIADAVLPLETISNKKPFLKKLTSGSLNFLKENHLMQKIFFGNLSCGPFYWVEVFLQSSKNRT